MGSCSDPTCLTNFSKYITDINYEYLRHFSRKNCEIPAVFPRIGCFLRFYKTLITKKIPEKTFGYFANSAYQYVCYYLWSRQRYADGFQPCTVTQHTQTDFSKMGYPILEYWGVLTGPCMTLYVVELYHLHTFYWTRGISIDHNHIWMFIFFATFRTKYLYSLKCCIKHITPLSDIQVPKCLTNKILI